MKTAATLLTVGLAAGVVGCTDDPTATATATAAVTGVDGPQYDRFRAFDQSNADAYGVKGFLPPNAELADVYYDMTDSQRKGLATWDLFASENGDFFRVSQKVTWNGQNMLRVLDSRGRDDRFDRMGVLNDPDCVKRTTPDQFGLYLDDCNRDPYSGGIIGLRLRPNPKFDLAAWKALGKGDVNAAAARWLKAPKDRFEWKSQDQADVVAVEPPYEVAMTCTVCHSAPNPLAPPIDPDRAGWKNIVFALGNQYFQEGKVFGDGIPDDDFLRQVLDSQHPGTSDTSRMATDHIHNPNVINSLANLPDRPLHKERVAQRDDDGGDVDNSDIKPETCDGTSCEVDTFRVLKDGADSSGVSGAALRVFINIGSCFGELSANIDPVWGVKHPVYGYGRTETPISRRKLAEDCNDYKQLLGLAPYLIDYLTFIKPYHLKDAPGGATYVKAWDDPQVKLGRQVFAEECATCHSSRQPESPDGKPSRADTVWEQQFAAWPKAQQLAWLKDPARVAWFKQQVENPEFFAHNYLADDRRYPVSLLGTNIARAMGTNAAPGNVWAEYASIDYQKLAPVDVPIYGMTLFGNVVQTGTIKGPPARGYYRTPSLWNIWTSAPFLSNNGLGTFNGGVSVQERVAAFETSMEQLLGLRARPGAVTKTTHFSALTTVPLSFDLPSWIPGIDIHKLKLGLPIPPGVPVAVIANLELPLLHDTHFSLADAIGLLTGGPQFWMSKLQDFITVFDPIEDKGHEFGYGRTEAEKRALIEFLKTL
jgi:cytochrome c5